MKTKHKSIYVSIESEAGFTFGASWCNPKHRTPRNKKSPFKEMEKDPVKWFSNLIK